jgi:hypothetical protein
VTENVVLPGAAATEIGDASMPETEISPTAWLAAFEVTCPDAISDVMRSRLSYVFAISKPGEPVVGLMEACSFKI